jgi:hypothetical protein
LEYLGVWVVGGKVLVDKSVEAFQLTEVRDLSLNDNSERLNLSSFKLIVTNGENDSFGYGVDDLSGQHGRS